MSLPVRRVAVSLLAALALSGVAYARQSVLVEPPRTMLVAPDGAASAERVKAAVIAGSSGLGWVVREDPAGRLRLSYNKQGKHEVTIDCLYDAQGYQLKYVSSMNMNYEKDSAGEQIHPNYNRWIANLIKTIGQAYGASAPR